MWTDKIIRSAQRLPQHFGLVVTDFCRRPESKDGSDCEKRRWRARVSIKEITPGSAWVVTLSGEETILRPLYAALTGKDGRATCKYTSEITVCLLRVGWIRLENRSSDESWAKLEALWQRLWSELDREGFVEVPLSPPESRAEGEPQGQATLPAPWDVALLAADIGELVEFFIQGWDFVVPEFEAHDGRLLRLDNAVLCSSEIHRTFRSCADGRMMVTLSASVKNSDEVSWNLASAAKALQFILTPIGTKTKVQEVLLERGAWHFLRAVLDRIMSAYPQSERSITQLIGSMEGYLGLRRSRESGSEPSEPAQKARVSKEVRERAKLAMAEKRKDPAVSYQGVATRLNTAHQTEEQRETLKRGGGKLTKDDIENALNTMRRAEGPKAWPRWAKGDKSYLAVD